ncbi:MAG TPA: hypothetical protein VFX58_19530 [Chitinophagaceae bacterium]|nr:hypothetical protein [Chitinophagaceae bacterium]
MKKLVLSLLLLLITIHTILYAQDTLPRFSVRNVGNNKIILGWTNTFQTIKQISIQRSFDSLQGYRTILTVADPRATLNGYVDAKATNDHMFYRLYIMLDKGVYLFSDAKRPVLDTMRRTAYNDRLDQVNGNDSVALPNFGINNKPRPEVFVPSLHVFTSKDGYVAINLPDDESRKYNIKFFSEDDDFLFELKDVKPRTFKLDKTNFHHAGWFKFELYEDGKLKEKHKFYLRKEF